MKSVTMIALLLVSSQIASAGPLAYGICQTGCNAVVVACYTAGGFTFGTGKREASFRNSLTQKTTCDPFYQLF